MKIMMLGDSYLEGFVGEDIRSKETIKTVSSYLTEKRFGGHSVFCQSYRGWSIQDLTNNLSKIDAPSNNGSELIFIFIGANNILFNKNMGSSEENYRKLLEKAKTFLSETGQVILMPSPPMHKAYYAGDRYLEDRPYKDYNVASPYIMKENMVILNDIIECIAEEDPKVVYLEDLLKEMKFVFSQPDRVRTAYFADGIHFNQLMHQSVAGYLNKNVIQPHQQDLDKLKLAEYMSSNINR